MRIVKRKSKNLKPKSNGMTDSQIELLINSKNPEDVKLAVNLLESRENLKRVEAKMSSFENWDKERKIRL